MRIALGEELMRHLDEHQRERGYSDEVTESRGAFLLDPGLGPALYLTRDGRVLVDARGWDGTGIREADDQETTRALVVGALKTGIADLLNLLPPRPRDAQTCATCDGARLVTINAEGTPYELVCFVCSGRGWVGSEGPSESTSGASPPG